MSGFCHTDGRSVPNSEFFADIAALLREGWPVTLRTKGRSMFPFIYGGRDEVTLVSPVTVRKGDIVLARISGGTHVLHRVIAVSSGTLVLMGDGNVRQEERCRAEDVIGVVTVVVRDGRSVGCSSRTWRFFSAAWIMLLPVRRYLLWGLRRLYRINNRF